MTNYFSSPHLNSLKQCTYELGIGQSTDFLQTLASQLTRQVQFRVEIYTSTRYVCDFSFNWHISSCPGCIMAIITSSCSAHVSAFYFVH